MQENIWKNVQQVKVAIASNNTRSDVIKSLNKSPTTSMYRRLRLFEQEHNVDVSHYVPWNAKGRKRSVIMNRKLTSDQIFKRNSPVAQAVLKNRIMRDSLLPYVCKKCNNSGEWMGEKITLQLEHINGDHSDNRLTNLCFMCPNCHSQTLTFCGRNTNRPVKSRAERRNIYLHRVKSEATARNEKLIQMLTSSNIDVNIRGWKTEAANLLGMPPQRLKRWMLRYCPELYK